MNTAKHINAASLQGRPIYNVCTKGKPIMPNTLADEIIRAKQLAQAMIDEYVAWRGKITYGEEIQAMYMDILDFVNFRIETADTCLLLIKNGRIADALGLSRSLFENYLLLMLMCRGTKLFQLQDLSNLTEGQFKNAFAEKQTDLQALQEAGKTACLAVAKYPRAKRHLMYVFEGFRSPDISDFFIPAHYFHFRNFRPEALRLKDENYFQYFEPSEQTKKATRGHQENEKARYRFYLSYEGLLQCLELNGLADNAVQARIEAHYTFLGRFLHPTPNAARDLHEQSNIHDGKTRIGMNQAYAENAILLACVYVCYILAATLDEVTDLFEQAPAKYMSNPGTSDLSTATARVPAEFPYFWFLFNDPPLYDRFNYCVAHATDEELAGWGGYEGVPFERVTFDQHIYSHLQQALNGWRNIRCGEYRSPLA
jgi:hypothetical protein